MNQMSELFQNLSPESWFDFRLYKNSAFVAFREDYIATHTGKPLLLVKIRNLAGISLYDFLQILHEKIGKLSDKAHWESPTTFYAIGEKKEFYIGVSPVQEFFKEDSNMFHSIFGALHDGLSDEYPIQFDFGIGRTQSNYISSQEEIFQELDAHADMNLEDNIRRWNWTSLNRVNNYFAIQDVDAVIQPIVFYHPKKKTFSVRGGEVFVGGNHYTKYGELLKDISHLKNAHRIDLLILEKLIIACKGAPGILKFNISPQTLINLFDQDKKIHRFLDLISQAGLNPARVRLELVEKPFDEDRVKLRDICQEFYEAGVTFAADDFGLRSSSHQVVLELGELIKEFKLDPISFKFRVEEDHIKFLDNLAFIQYCKQLANNRDAIITAEALEDIDTLDFLLGQQVYHFQANMFCGKLKVGEYIEKVKEMQNLPGAVVFDMLHDHELYQEALTRQNIFELAKEKGLF
jgi:EAL domain-containing protein (putative c-di-GMP-specific phosphodiesterase class I)